jgi:hypothetical protein
MNLAIKAYPGCGGVDESFKLLLVENVLKLASRRHPTSIQEEMSDPEVQGRFLETRNYYLFQPIYPYPYPYPYIYSSLM